MNLGIEVQFFDCAVDGSVAYQMQSPHTAMVGDMGESLMQLIADTGVTTVLISSTCTSEQIVVDQLIRGIKSRFPKIVVILGGIHASVKPSWHFDQSDPDYIVIGEGEHTIAELLLKHGQSNFNPSEVAGLVLRDSNGRLVSTGARPRLTNVNSPWAIQKILKRPDGTFRYFDSGTRKSHIYASGLCERRAASFAFYGSRGCPFSCPYCATTPRDGRRIRHMGASRMFDDFIIARQEFGVSVFYNQADTFGLHPEDRRFVKLIAEYRCQSSDRNFVLNNPNAFFLNSLFAEKPRDAPDEAFIDDLLAAGFNVVTLAIETFSQRLNRKVNFDRVDFDDVVTLCQVLKRKGLRVDLYMMYGLPDQEMWEFERDWEYAYRLRPIVDTISWHAFTLLPGTIYFEEAIRTGRITEKLYRETMNQGIGFFTFDNRLNFSRIPAEIFVDHLADYEPAWYEPNHIQTTPLRLSGPSQTPASSPIQKMYSSTWPVAD